MRKKHPSGQRGPSHVSNEAVYQAYCDLCNANPPIAATRKAVALSMGVSYNIIDDHTKRLLTGTPERPARLQRVIDGVFEPVDKFESRPVWFAVLPHGGAKLELGDQVMDFQNMREGWIALRQIEGWLKSKHGHMLARKTKGE